MLDATEPAEQLGKTAGKDRRSDKATYVRVHGLEAARRKADELLAEAEAALTPLGARAELLRELARLIVRRRA